MSSLFTSLLQRKVQEQDSPLHKIDPRIKFLFFLWISVWAYIFLDYYVNIFFLTGIMVLALVGKTLKRIVGAFTIIIIPWMAVSVPILGALFPWNETPIYSIRVFQWDFTLYYEGVAWGDCIPIENSCMPHFCYSIPLHNRAYKVDSITL